jgi:SAM-dependent methyltransferase
MELPGGGLRDDGGFSIRNLQKMVSAGMFYDEDLAYIHDQGFTDMARAAARTVLDLLKAQKIKNGLVVDLGCGSGVLAEKLTRAGYDVLGIDMSEAMLRLARKRAPLARFERGSLFRTSLPDCVAVCAIGECVNYLFDRNGASRLAPLLRRVHRALKTRGAFMFDIAEPGRGSKASFVHSEGDDWAVLVRKEVDVRRETLTRRMTVFRKVGPLYRRSEEVHRQKLYSVAQIRTALEAAGFQVTRLRGYGTARFAPERAGFIARKPK